MITNITLENFKCFRQVSINPKRLTVLIGPNGTGKSSILQALLLLKQSVGEEDYGIGECLIKREFPYEGVSCPQNLGLEEVLRWGQVRFDDF